MRLRLLVLIFFIATGCSIAGDVYIRINQVGFLSSDIKSGVVLAENSLTGKSLSLVNIDNGEEVKRIPLFKNEGKYGNFSYSYKFDFSDISSNGKYYIKYGKYKSYTFYIGDKLYNEVVETLYEFFKIQRCGYTDPKYHGVCHIADATSLYFNGRQLDKKIDVTGGWHDAADYVKFFNTTAYTTYLMLFAYDFDSDKFGFDYDNNNVPDLLDEAKIGLDWLLRANYRDHKFITQVQDLRDHDVGWRLPENDPLAFDRPAFAGIGKNLIGLFSATMGLASRIWKDRFGLTEFADKCLTAGEQKYSIWREVENIDSSGTGMYLDNAYWGKLALGAVELYKTTHNSKYLQEALTHADSANADYWWSWGNINSLAHYQLAKYDRKYIDYIKMNLDFFNKNKNEKLFGEAANHYWGTNNTLMGAGITAILYKKLTKSTAYDSLLCYQRDFVLGKNSWGLSFINDIGKKHSKNFHHQVAYFMDGNLPGGFAAGPVTKENLDSYNINFKENDKLSKFQSDSSYYRDDIMDYVTNEPTIGANITAIFVMGYFTK